ncbi:MAG: T9SS C-terminal target domain-containing protein [Ignavibacteriales bacterium]|nr:MAG: T9SS C-terminal target domain-containing protein [Ignavibacteriales bacterium]
MKKIFTIIFLFFICQNLFSQEKIDTVYYTFNIVNPNTGITSGTDNGFFLEGNYLTIKPQTLSSAYSQWQNVYDALVGSTLGLEIGSLDTTILLNITLNELNSVSSSYDEIAGQTVFMYLEVDVLERGHWYEITDHYYFKNGKKAFMNIPITTAFQNFCTSIGIDINAGISFAYLEVDNLGNEYWEPSGLSWFKDTDTIRLSLEHFSRFAGGGKTLSAVERMIDKPDVFNLKQNYPNPFNPTTNIIYSIPNSGYVEIKIYNVIGAEVQTLLAQQKNAGTYEITFNANNLSSGIYYYTIRYQNLQMTRKMILIK